MYRIAMRIVTSCLVFASPVVAGELIVGGPLIGCKTLVTIQRHERLWSDGDIEAAVKLMTRNMSDCASVEGIVFPEKTEEGFVCLRPKGDPDCYWVSEERVD